MIRLTRLDGSEIYINPDLIEIIEETPDTHVTLSNGNRYLVLEKIGTINEKIITHRARILRASAASLGKKYLQRERGNGFQRHRKSEE